MADLHKRKGEWTSGITVQIPNELDLRYFLFELDKDHLLYADQVKKALIHFRIDYLIHRTGSGGFHYLSPTILTKHQWKNIHNILGHINSICPMTTLRILPNKYANEDLFWYRHSTEIFTENYLFNSKNMCYYLNKIFGSKFEGLGEYDIRTVRYKLP